MSSRLQSLTSRRRFLYLEEMGASETLMGLTLTVRSSYGVYPADLGICVYLFCSISSGFQSCFPIHHNHHLVSLLSIFPTVCYALPRTFTLAVMALMPIVTADGAAHAGIKRTFSVSRLALYCLVLCFYTKYEITAAVCDIAFSAPEGIALSQPKRECGSSLTHQRTRGIAVLVCSKLRTYRIISSTFTITEVPDNVLHKPKFGFESPPFKLVAHELVSRNQVLFSHRVISLQRQ